jgi:hypothetical protein
MKASPLIWVSIALSTLAVLIAAGIALFVLFSVNKKVAVAPDNTVTNQIGIPTNTPEQPTTPGNTFYCDDQYEFGFEYPEAWGQPEIFGGLAIPSGGTATPRSLTFETTDDFSYLTIGANPPPFGLEEFEITDSKKVTVDGVEANWSTNTDRGGNHVAFLTFERATIGYVIIADFGHPYEKSDDSLITDLLESWVFSCDKPTTVSHEKDLESARNALVTFFEDLRDKKYTAAAEKISPSTYDFLAGLNSDITQAEDLLKFGCEESELLHCSVIKEIATEEALSSTEFLFNVVFTNPDGSLFALGPCCGEEEGESQTHFDYHVTKIGADQFLILEAPVYHP